MLKKRELFQSRKGSVNVRSVHDYGGGETHIGKEQETRRRILKAAEALFLSRGYKGVSMKDIADEVQVTAAALYYHFPGGKQEVFLSMLQMMFEGWSEGAQEAIAEKQGIQAQLSALLYYILSLPFRNLMALARDIEVQTLDEVRQKQLFLPLRESYLSLVRRIFQQAIDNGEITERIPIDVLASMYQGIAMGIQHGEQLSSSFSAIAADKKALADMVIQGFLYGIARPARETQD